MRVLYIVFGFGIYFVYVWWLNVKNIKLFGFSLEVRYKSINFATVNLKMRQVMNENIDLTKILRNCPKGWKLWSPIFGEIEFYSIVEKARYPIMLSCKNKFFCIRTT